MDEAHLRYRPTTLSRLCTEFPQIPTYERFFFPFRTSAFMKIYVRSQLSHCRMFSQLHSDVECHREMLFNSVKRKKKKKVLQFIHIHSGTTTISVNTARQPKPFMSPVLGRTDKVKLWREIFLLAYLMTKLLPLFSNRLFFIVLHIAKWSTSSFKNMLWVGFTLTEHLCKYNLTFHSCTAAFEDALNYGWKLESSGISFPVRFSAMIYISPYNCEYSYKNVVICGKMTSSRPVFMTLFTLIHFLSQHKTSAP